MCIPNNVYTSDAVKESAQRPARERIGKTLQSQQLCAETQRESQKVHPYCRSGMGFRLPVCCQHPLNTQRQDYPGTFPTLSHQVFGLGIRRAQELIRGRDQRLGRRDCNSDASHRRRSYPTLHFVSSRTWTMGQLRCDFQQSSAEHHGNPH